MEDPGPRALPESPELASGRTSGQGDSGGGESSVSSGSEELGALNPESCPSFTLGRGDMKRVSKSVQM